MIHQMNPSPLMLSLNETLPNGFSSIWNSVVIFRAGQCCVTWETCTFSRSVTLVKALNTQRSQRRGKSLRSNPTSVFFNVFSSVSGGGVRFPSRYPEALWCIPVYATITATSVSLRLHLPRQTADICICRNAIGHAGRSDFSACHSWSEGQSPLHANPRQQKPKLREAPLIFLNVQFTGVRSGELAAKALLCGVRREVGFATRLPQANESLLHCASSFASLTGPRIDAVTLQGS